MTLSVQNAFRKVSPCLRASAWSASAGTGSSGGWSCSPPGAGGPRSDPRRGLALGYRGHESERGAWERRRYLREFGARIGYPLSATRVGPRPSGRRRARRGGARGRAADRGDAANRHVHQQRVLAQAAHRRGVPVRGGDLRDRALFSAEVGCRKPDPEAFARLAGRLGIAPESLLFFDDGAPYVAGAREAGLQAHRFEGGGRRPGTPRRARDPRLTGRVA